MNREELKQLNAIIDRLIASNKQSLAEQEKKLGQAIAIMHTREEAMQSSVQEMGDRLDAYSQVLYRHSFYGGPLWRIEIIKKWFKRHSLLSQKPVMKKLEPEPSA